MAAGLINPLRGCSPIDVAAPVSPVCACAITATSATGSSIGPQHCCWATNPAHPADLQVVFVAVDQSTVSLCAVAIWVYLLVTIIIFNYCRPLLYISNVTCDCKHQFAAIFFGKVSPSSRPATVSNAWAHALLLCYHAIWRIRLETTETPCFAHSSVRNVWSSSTRVPNTFI